MTPSCHNQFDFVNKIDDYYNKSLKTTSKMTPTETKTLCQFLEANVKYLKSDLQKDTKTKIDTLLQKASQSINTQSSLYQTLTKIKKFTLEPAINKKTSVSPLHKVLDSLFGGQNGIQKAIDLLRHDRFTGETKLKDFLKESIGSLPPLDRQSIEKEPALALLVLMLNENPSEDHLRDTAADAYVKQYPEDTRFEKAYAYVKSPNILLAHLFIATNQWKSANPENKGFYDEQMAGIFHGSIVFDKGDKISAEELHLIHQKEGGHPQFPIDAKLKRIEDHYQVTDWLSTPIMTGTENRADDLFIPSRRVFQEQVLKEYLDQLQATSEIVQKVYSLPPDKSVVIGILGPYGVGKSTYVKQKFAKEKPITVYSADKLNEYLRKPTSTSQDHHFESVILSSKLLKGLAKVPAIITETAAIDEYRFNRFTKRDFSSRDIIKIIEIAPKNFEDVIKRFKEREGSSIDESRLGTAKTSLIDALRFRRGRVESTQENSKIDYTLLDTELSEIAHAKNGIVTIAEGQQRTFSLLIPGTAKL